MRISVNHTNNIIVTASIIADTAKVDESEFLVLTEEVPRTEAKAARYVGSCQNPRRDGIGIG